MSVAREASQSQSHPPAAPLVSAGQSNRCPVCGANLAVDQRYCVECGTRRGAPRFSLASSTVGAAAASAATPPPRPNAAQRFTRWTSGASLLLGLLILLVALGIGVLIGHNGNAKVAASQPKVNVTLNGGGTSGATSAGAATSASTGAGSSSSSSTSAKATKKTAAKPASTKAAAATNPNAAATGKAGTKAAAKTFAPTATKKSTLGGSCTPGTAGCSGGKQTGNLF